MKNLKQSILEKLVINSHQQVNEKLVINKHSKSKNVYCSTIKEVKKKYELHPQHEYRQKCNYTYDVTPEIEKVFADLIDDKGPSCKELTDFIQAETNNTDISVGKGFYSKYSSYQVTLSIESISTEVGGIEIYPLSRSKSGIEFYYGDQYSSEKVPILEILCKLFDYIIESANGKS